VDIFEERKKVINQVIRRMIKHEGSIVAMESEGGEGGEGGEEETANQDEDEAALAQAKKKSKNPMDKLLRLHPSYNI